MRSHARPWWRDRELDFPGEQDPSVEWDRLQGMFEPEFEKMRALSARGVPLAWSYDGGNSWILNQEYSWSPDQPRLVRWDGT